MTTNSSVVEPPHYRSEQGGTLAEVIVSTAVFSVVAAALFSCFANGMLYMELARENQRAIQIIMDKTETIRLYNWDQVRSNGFIPRSFTNLYDAGNAASVVFVGTVDITNVPISTAYSKDMRQVTINLTWRTGKVQRSRECTTFISRYGLQNYIY